MTSPAFWRGKRIFLTGHTGFKGSWLSLWLQKMGAGVTGYALPPSTSPNMFEATHASSGMVSVIGDVRDGVALASAMKAAEPEIVIHMAAQPLVRYSYQNPVETYAVNVMGLVNLFEAVRQTGSIKAVVNVTSDKCYENREWVWGYRETEAMGGYDPYSSSKGCAELVTSAYRRSYFNASSHDDQAVGLASARAGNVIGGGDWALDRLVPDIMRAIDGGRAVKIRNPHAVRPWQHVLEPLNGYLTLAEQLCNDRAAASEGWNFGPKPTDVQPVQWVVEKLIDFWGEGARWLLDENQGEHEANYLSLDCAKARARLGWQPVWDLAKALEMIVVWHKAYRHGKDIRAVTFEQITKFENQL